MDTTDADWGGGRRRERATHVSVCLRMCVELRGVYLCVVCCVQCVESSV